MADHGISRWREFFFWGGVRIRTGLGVGDTLAGMEVIRTISGLRERRASLSGRVALVPTMGALHDGHMALVARGREVAEHVIVSIFVNPTQFGQGEDLERYPRPLEADVARCLEAGVEVVFAPPVEEVYPPDEMDLQVDVPELTGVLEGERRPGHFAGVCRVVAKLFNMIEPDTACFGRKDYQQLAVIGAMVRGLDFPIEIEAVDTVREASGLAMSSRNEYLDEAQRHHAAGIYKALQQAKHLVEHEGETDPDAVERAMAEVLAAHHLEVDYAVLRHPATLSRLEIIEPLLTGGVVALIAVRLGSVRLIDNMQLAPD